ncbi:hypothetical protein F2Q69_00044963 [Brassica cretica]|uniref:5-formyltetrahydrofolate cyclo-ligase n=1 Tax=Brassica cretica TaxID=69181 RepID=A0A8S9NE23_BRACR|nr:hypothetical protein F2Q69_00044963 [Brassica cretica]
MIEARVFSITTSIFFFPRILTRPVSRLQPATTRSVVAMSTTTSKSQEELDSIFKQKRIVRSTVRKSLKAMDPSLRTQQDDAIQNTVLEAPWFKSCRGLCAYISCKSLNEVDTSKILSKILQHPARVFSITTSIFFSPRILTRPVSRLQPAATRSAVAMSTTTSKSQEEFDSIFKQKRIVRSTVRKSLKAMDPSIRTQQDDAIQNTVLEAPWFKSCRGLCAYISCKSLNEVDTSKILSKILQHPGTTTTTTTTTTALSSQSFFYLGLFRTSLSDINKNVRICR